VVVLDIRKLLATATPYVESLYDRVATIKRHVEYTKPNGSTGQRWEVIHEKVPCRLSTLGMQTLKNTLQGDVNRIEYDAKLILSTDHEILAGDEATVHIIENNIVTHTDELEKSSEPFVYVTHQEVLFKRKAYA